jgi:hypothetical protein
MWRNKSPEAATSLVLRQAVQDRDAPSVRQFAMEPKASLKCRSCWKGRHPPVHMFKLTAER